MDAAVDKLKALLKIGSLKVITSEHAHEVAADCPGSPDPAHYVIHDVTRLEGPNHLGLVTAWTDEGDWCQGRPEALLKRLTETGV